MRFFVWLTTYANHHEFLAMVRQGSGLRVVYGGNFIDACHVAQAVGGFISQVVS
jgi:hypothetical protein